MRRELSVAMVVLAVCLSGARSILRSSAFVKKNDHLGAVFLSFMASVQIQWTSPLITERQAEAELVNGQEGDSGRPVANIGNRSGRVVKGLSEALASYAVP